MRPFSFITLLNVEYALGKGSIEILLLSFDTLGLSKVNANNKSKIGYDSK
jgi:hypothetical protein